MYFLDLESEQSVPKNPSEGNPVGLYLGQEIDTLI